ncbi:SDR family NAD(P)-dependent oxidoreductase [Acidiphilium acidophilum]|uniref:SDR family NAD(P)-dependent oxidoreductase n=1 Tax=Acidiphilium acidophilum TaxID=76588 RepID=A0AAW9DRR6_ACIAO|nr:SDR family NAD(P)-dependent oxidoreductase [Acidiphilium acidophilum]MDX5931856.1 SDR family NAD(P)-dependent oxidoreductase [Acidiphilium acidophilum]GBR74795.1 short-chain dehydrogenase [Acidiphilium acidophilum DSM 700]
MNLAGKTALVTGGGSGLGAATVAMLVEAGAAVMIADIEPPKASVTTARFHRTDVTSESDGASAIAATITAFGSVHVLINCAGIAPGERVLGREAPHDLARFTRAVMVNLVGTFNMIRLAAAAMAGNAPDDTGSRGVIVNTASIAAFDGQIGQAAYAASKAGVVGMTLPIARELARSAIRVMTIAPGLFATPMMAGLPAAVQDSLGNTVPFPPRLGQPAEFAALVRHICENEMLNGETIRLDGALRLPPR